MKKMLFAIIVACVVPVSGYAETVLLKALQDFTNLNDGAVPYYTEDYRDAVAIDASNPAYRDVFARASTTFNGASGEYQVTINTLGEIDGECEFRFLVNGEVVGSAANNPTSDDFGQQQHTFQNISIAAGDEISVESNAVTNGEIPEGDITAYARGRWQSVTLESIYSGLPQSQNVDLALSVTSDTAQTVSGNTVQYQMTVHNNHQENTATAPVIGVSLPVGLQFVSSAECAVDGEAVTCSLPELAPNANANVSFTARATLPGNAEIIASASANEPEDNVDDNEVRYGLSVADSPTTAGAIPGAADNSANAGGSMDRFLLLALLATLLLRIAGIGSVRVKAARRTTSQARK